MPKSKKQPRLKKALIWIRPTSPVKGALVFALVFGLAAGGYYLYNSFAAEPAGMKVLAERLNTGEKPFDNTRLVPPETVSFRLYENGLVICGGYTDTAHPARYYSTTLTAQQITNFQTSVAQTGFYSLEKTIGPEGNVTSDNYQQVSFLNNNVGYVVLADPAYQKPAAYSATNALIDTLCASLTSPYQPEEVQVTTKVVSDPSLSISSTRSAPIKLNIQTTTTEPTEQTISGTQAQTLNQSLGKTGQQVYANGTQTIEVRADEVLPLDQPIIDGVDSQKVSVSGGLKKLLASNVAYAGGPVPEFYTFCPKDVACLNRYPQKHLDATKGFFRRTINQTFDSYTGSQNGVFYGRHNFEYYKNCRSPAYNLYGCGSTLRTVLGNITYEIYHEHGWRRDKPTLFLLGAAYRDSNVGLCGIAYMGPGGNRTGVTAFGPTGSFTCSKTGSDSLSFMVAAHEFGHLLGLHHINGSTELMSPNGCYSHNLAVGCKLHPIQGSWLVYNSQWLYPLPKK